MIRVTVEMGPADGARGCESRGVARQGSRGIVAGRGAIFSIRVEGHAGFAKRGEDIVCAAASATVYTAAGALRELCGADETCMTEKKGFFELVAPRFDDMPVARDAEIIMETAYIGYRQIEASYPAFLRVTVVGGGVGEAERNDETNVKDKSTVIRP